MIIAMTVLATLISTMFVGTVAASIAEMQRETKSDEFQKRYNIL